MSAIARRKPPHRALLHKNTPRLKAVAFGKGEFAVFNIAEWSANGPSEHQEVLGSDQRLPRKSHMKVTKSYKIRDAYETS